MTFARAECPPLGECTPQRGPGPDQPAPADSLSLVQPGGVQVTRSDLCVGRTRRGARRSVRAWCTGRLKTPRARQRVTHSDVVHKQRCHQGLRALGGTRDGSPARPRYLVGARQSRVQCAPCPGTAFTSRALPGPQPWHTPRAVPSPFSAVLAGRQREAEVKVNSQGSIRLTPPLHASVALGSVRVSARTEGPEARAPRQERGGVSHPAGTFLRPFRTRSFRSKSHTEQPRPLFVSISRSSGTEKLQPRDFQQEPETRRESRCLGESWSLVTRTKPRSAPHPL